MVRRSGSGRASLVAWSTEARSRAPEPDETPNARSTAVSVDLVVTSDVEMPIRSSSISRRCRPSWRAEATTSPARPRADGGDRVEEVVGLDPDSSLSEGVRKHRRVAVDAGRDRPEPVGPVVDGVHGGDDGQQHLGGADVGGRLVATDVLLAGLQRESVGRAALGVDGHPDQPTGQVALEPLGDGHEAGVGSAVEQRDAEPLGGADDHVGAELAGCFEKGEREQVGGDHVPGRSRSCAASITGRGSRIRPDAPGYCTRTPHSSPSGSPSDRSATTTSMPIASARVRTHVDRLRQRVRVDDERTGRLAVAAAYQRHRLGDRGALVEQGGVGGGQAGQVADDGLEVEQGLEPALRDLGLVRRVGGVPARGPRGRCAGSRPG